MKRIVFLPRFVAARWVPIENSVLISIYDRSELPLQPQSGWKDILYLRFHDIDTPEGDLELFDVEKAKEILAFVDKHTEAEELVVHCYLGRMRSAAVALYLSEKLGIPCFQEQTPVTALTWKCYNRRVYSCLMEAEYGPIGEALRL